MREKPVRTKEVIAVRRNRIICGIISVSAWAMDLVGILM